MYVVLVNNYSPVADPSVVDTVMVILIDDGLVRISTGWNSSFSLTVYTERSKCTVGTKKHIQLLIALFCHLQTLYHHKWN